MRFHAAFLLVAMLFGVAVAQDRLQTMPRYDRYTRLTREISGSVKSGSASITWSEDSKSFFYSFDGKNYKYDLEKKKADETTEPFPGRTEENRGRRRGRQQGSPERGRQFSTVTSPDEKLKATSRDRNVYIADADGKNELAVTTDGSVEKRVKYGIASWVYGEELGVRNAMWWSPDSKKLAYYKFDEAEVKDYFITLDEGSIQDRLDTEPYPKAGAPNPKVALFIYDLDSKQSTRVQVDFGDAGLDEYVYDVRWSEDGKHLFFNRTNRKQNVMQFCSADPATGAAHSIVEERQPQSWAENHPEISFLKDGDRFIWSSERNGFKNYYLYNLEGKLLKTLTNEKLDVGRIARVDEDADRFFYTGSGPENPYFRQLHRVGLDGRHNTLITSPDLDHEVTISPDGKHFVDVVQSPDHPAETRLLDDRGHVKDTFLRSDTSKFESLGLKKTEVFTYTAADGKTLCYGTIQFPSDFDPKQKYPIVLTVYGGPESGPINTRFQTPNPIAELGFLVVNLAGRGTTGRGKEFRDAVYEKLGVVEIDDQNAGIQSLASRPYADVSRVGVFGTSYGGYSTVMLMLRHPETFSVGCASSSVTDWRNYDSIYTERYMGLPTDEDNKGGYDKGSAMKYAGDLKGRLMLYFGSADNNVHPANTYQLTHALETAGKSYDMTVGTDRGHTQMNATRMWEYFVTHLILQPRQDPLKTAWNKRKYRKSLAKRIVHPNGASSTIKVG
ncbi:MAG TPA: DPP IV N-terminal domain-containing protein [Fimbriimonas sp.]|nr:DPP IV N-terminal domain-containing protein [Fimbriimonas sp.]